jgi:ribosomal protein S18 acetylase RimI-like enzyme
VSGLPLKGLEVRVARPEEYAAVTELTLEVYVGGGYIPADDSYVEELSATERRAVEADVLVAVEDGAVLGAVTYCPPGSSWREIAAEDEGEFRMLAVSVEARGRGVGLALIRACVDRARETGLRGVAISTMSEMTDAHRLYGRLGFTRVPDSDWSPHSGVCLMAFRLRF